MLALGSTSPESQDQDYLTPVNHNGGGGGVDRSGEKGKVEKENDSPTATPSQDPDTISLPYGTFRRYNSLRIKKGISVRKKRYLCYFVKHICVSLFVVVTFAAFMQGPTIFCKAKDGKYFFS